MYGANPYLNGADAGYYQPGPAAAGDKFEDFEDEPPLLEGTYIFPPLCGEIYTRRVKPVFYTRGIFYSAVIRCISIARFFSISFGRYTDITIGPTRGIKVD